MNSSTLRRLASDHSALHTAELPPYYLFPPTGASSAASDDLTQLSVLLTGPQDTPYADGLWKLCLKIPEDYPKTPPKAVFKTRIWHPNVDEKSGGVCVDTLKRDWDSRLTLRDILVTISCLLIQPNPDSALNSAAGHLLQEDYESFSRQAELMTSIHARIPAHLKDAVLDAKRRGEATKVTENSTIDQPCSFISSGSASPLAGKSSKPAYLSAPRSMGPPRLSINRGLNQDDGSDDEAEDEASASKENDPWLSPLPIRLPIPPRSSRPAGSKKRPLSDLPTPPEPSDEEIDQFGLSPSERNIANNTPYVSDPPSSLDTGSAHESFTLTERNQAPAWKSHGFQEGNQVGLAITPSGFQANGCSDEPTPKRQCFGDEKENFYGKLLSQNTSLLSSDVVIVNQASDIAMLQAVPMVKSAVPSSSNVKGPRSRLGIRRL